MLERLYARAEFVGRFVRVDGKPPLQDPRAAIQYIGNEMHGTAVPPLAGVEHTLVRIEARIGR